MADDKLAGIMRDFVKTLETGDVEKALSFFSDDNAIVMVNPDGTFEGRENVRRYLAHMANRMKEMSITPTGHEIITNGNKAFFEHQIDATIDGKRGSVLAMCAYEFADDKIQKIRTTYDRLNIAQQAASGWLAKTLVNLIVKAAEKGL